VPPASNPFTTTECVAAAVVIDLRENFPDVALPKSGVDAAFLPPVTSADTSAILDLCMAARIGTVVLSGARNGADLQHLDILLQVSEARVGITAGATRIVAMAGDNPHGLLAAANFANKSKRLIGLGWDSHSLAVAMGLQGKLGSDVAASGRATLLLAAAAAKVAAIDTSEPEPDTGIFRTACLHAKAQGFRAKMTGRLSQVPVIEEVFAG